MAEFSRRFNFDDFEELCAEALGEHRLSDLQLLFESQELEEAQQWEEHDHIPSELGTLLCWSSVDPLSVLDN